MTPIEIANELGLAENTYKSGAWLGRIDSTIVDEMRISTMDELGANEWWVPGMQTSGGQFETVISRIDNIDIYLDNGTIKFEELLK